MADLDQLGGRVTLTTLAELKKTWGVSIKMLVVRFRQLGRIDDQRTRSLYKQISARRWNKTESVPTGHEHAIWLTKPLNRAGLDSTTAAPPGLAPRYMQTRQPGTSRAHLRRISPQESSRSQGSAMSPPVEPRPDEIAKPYQRKDEDTHGGR